MVLFIYIPTFMFKDTRFNCETPGVKFSTANPSYDKLNAVVVQVVMEEYCHGEDNRHLALQLNWYPCRMICAISFMISILCSPELIPQHFPPVAFLSSASNYQKTGVRHEAL